MNRVLFRADGNAEIGAGHIMRCLSIAAALATQGRACRFVLASEAFAPTVRGRGFACDVLQTDYADMESELPRLEPLLAAEKPDQIVVDSYFVTPRYLRVLGRHAPVTYVDDLAAFAYPADTLVNYNLYGPDLSYAEVYRQAGEPLPRLILGVAYAPLRAEFQNLPPHPDAESVKDILVSTGGADHEHVALRMAEHLQQHPEATAGRQYHFVAGPVHPDRQRLEQAAASAPWLVLHENVQNMSQLMLRCDAAVSAAGSTLYELCACRVPFITYILADNQIPGAETFDRHGLGLCAGDCRQDANFPGTVFALLETLCGDAPRRARIKQKMAEMIDGRGALRLAERLTERRL